MARSIYISSAEGHSGKSTIAMGVLDTLLRSIERVGVFRPVARSTQERDYVLELLLAHDGVNLDYDECVGVTYEEVHDDADAALSRIVDRFKQVERKCDAVVIIGSDYTDVATPTELGFNARVAANLGAPVILVLTGRSVDESRPRTLDELRQIADLSLPELHNAHASLLAVIANRADPDAIDEIAAALGEQTGVPAWAIPEDPLLVAPTVDEVKSRRRWRAAARRRGPARPRGHGRGDRRDVGRQRAAAADRGVPRRHPWGSQRGAARGAHGERERDVPVHRGCGAQRRVRACRPRHGADRGARRSGSWRRHPDHHDHARHVSDRAAHRRDPGQGQRALAAQDRHRPRPVRDARGCHGAHRRRQRGCRDRRDPTHVRVHAAGAGARGQAAHRAARGRRRPHPAGREHAARARGGRAHDPGGRGRHPCAGVGARGGHRGSSHPVAGTTPSMWSSSRRSTRRCAPTRA